MNNKNKFIIICIIGVILLSVLGFLISSNIFKRDKTGETQVSSDKNIVINNNTNNNGSKVEEISKEDKYENIVLTSKIGTEILSKFCISNIYSNILYSEIDKNGLSEDAKLMYTYITITSNYYYHNMVKSSEELGEYISKEDFETVYKELFGNNSVVNHKSFITETLYNKEKGYYEYLTFGYGGIEFDFVVEVPYEIKEYENRVEALFYRIYCKATSSVNEDGEAEQSVYLYNDSTRSNKVYSSDDNKLQDNDSQKEYITELIESKTIDKNILETITYTLQEENNTYYICDIKK